jgi:hypothetical protein
MTAEPLTRAERHTGHLYDATCRECRYEATVERLEAALRKISELRTGYAARDGVRARAIARAALEDKP